jgi:hypothetical protein
MGRCARAHTIVTRPATARTAACARSTQMASETSGGPGHLTVGSLMADAPAADSGEAEGPNWSIDDGSVGHAGGGVGYTTAGVERLSYNNPYGQVMERVWFDGKTVFAIELGEVEIDVNRVKVAQEYQVVYGVELTPEGKLAREPDRVPGQLNIYDSVPGMQQYSPLWQFNYVVVPRSYRANTLRSERDCLASGYPIHKSTVVEN